MSLFFYDAQAGAVNHYLGANIATMYKRGAAYRTN
jgi:hypothetical protein